MATAIATVAASEAYTVRATLLAIVDVTVSNLATAMVATTTITAVKVLKFKILKYYRTNFSPKIQDQ